MVPMKAIITITACQKQLLFNIRMRENNFSKEMISTFFSRSTNMYIYMFHSGLFVVVYTEKGIANFFTKTFFFSSNYSFDKVKLLIRYEL